MSIACSVLPLRHVDNEPGDSEPSDHAARPPASAGHTVVTPSAYDSSTPKASDLATVLLAPASPRSHTVTTVETSKNQVDTESSPVQQAIAGLLACSNRCDSTPILGPDVDAPDLSGDSLVTPNSMRDSGHAGRYLYLSFIRSAINFDFAFTPLSLTLTSIPFSSTAIF